MFTILKKIFLANILVLVVLTSGTWQGNHVVLAQGQTPNVPETPLYPGLAWTSLGSSTREIQLSLNGDSVTLSGAAYAAADRFESGLPQDVLNYYSNEQLAGSGWTSFDVVERSDGVQYVFDHESGVFLSVEILSCSEAASGLCVTVWESEPTNLRTTTPDSFAEPNLPTATGSFGKTAPVDGATNVNPASAVLSWGAYSPTPDKYSYCIKEGSACAANDPNWTGASSMSVTLTNLASNKTYYWQVKAITCITCVPKTYVYADGGTWWTFTTKANQVKIVGNAGAAEAVLHYTDGTAKSVTADSTGAYAIAVPYNWTGTITPEKAGYLFSPINASFTNLKDPQTIQNFTAIPAYTISGSVVLPGVTLSYTDGTPKTVTSGSNGHYSITVPANWSGTVTPSKTGYTFSPASRTYPPVTSNKTSQNYAVLVSISGNAGVAGATLSYTDGTAKTATADGSGAYEIIVPRGWTGTVTPSKTGFTFTPSNRSYNNLLTSQTGQDYTALDAPIVLSSVRVNDSPTSAASVGFTVTFSESVTGVDTGDFALTTTGLTGTSITNVSGSGAVYTITANTGSGSGTLRLDVIDDDSIQDGGANPLSGGFTGGQLYEVNQMTLLSTGGADGWVLEASELANTGGILNKAATTLRVGDEASNAQYRSILSFNTSMLPQNAQITSVMLKFKYAGVAGANPFNTHGFLLVDVRHGAFSNALALQSSDFAAKGPLLVYKAKVLTYTNAVVDNWYSQSFNPLDFGFIDPDGVTQFRLRFGKDDNNDFGADFLKLFSGNATQANRPQLIIQYEIVP